MQRGGRDDLVVIRRLVFFVFKAGARCRRRRRDRPRRLPGVGDVLLQALELSLLAQIIDGDCPRRRTFRRDRDIRRQGVDHFAVGQRARRARNRDLDLMIARLHPEKTGQQIGQSSTFELHRPAIGIEVERLRRRALRRCPVEDEQRMDFEAVVPEIVVHLLPHEWHQAEHHPRLVLLRSVDRAEIQRAASRIDGFPARAVRLDLIKPSRRLIRRVIRLLPEAGF